MSRAFVLAMALCATGAMAAPSEPTPAAGDFHLIPQPRELAPRASLPLDHGLSVSIAPGASAEDRFTAEDLRDTLRERDILPGESASAVHVQLLRTGSTAAMRLLAGGHLSFDPAMQAEGYILTPVNNGVAVIAASSEGLFYGAQTVKQLVEGSGKEAHLLTATIRDWPALRYRGLDDDLSRGPLPTLEFQKHQVRSIAAYKMNIYSPYFEHTLAYASNPLAALPGGAMSRADVEELVRYAQSYHVTIVPEQEAFGHLHNVLLWEQYGQLAETPRGAVLAPGQPGSLPLIQQWFTEIAGQFPGPFIHIGADETFELGRGQTSADLQKRGLGAIYIDFLTQIYKQLQPLHKRILFWGDVAMNEPDLVKTLPKDMIAVPWNYSPQRKGFDRFIVPFTQAGMETWVAPGVNGWNRVYPDNNFALYNIQGFIRDGQRLGATGALTTVWDDDGEGLFDQDWYGALFGAAASWQSGESPVDAYQQKFGAAFHGDTTGKIDQAQRELMAAHALLAKVDEQGASDHLFWVDPWSPEGKQLAKKVRPVAHDVRLHAERAIVLLSEAQFARKLREPAALAAMEMGARRVDLIGLKFELADDIVAAYGRAFAAQDDKSRHDDVERELDDISSMNGRCQDLRSAYALTRDLYSQVWLRENRPYWLGNVLARYDMAIQLWISRADAVTAAHNSWGQGKKLPPPEQIGIPADIE